MPAASDSTCQLAVLAAREPDAGSILCDASSGSMSLPTVQVEAEPSTASVQAAIETLLRRPSILLRASSVQWHDNWDAAAMFVEIEPIDGEAPQGLRWSRIGEADAALVHPGWARGSVAGWLTERTNGWSPLRPQWSRPGWLAEAGGWMLDQMRRAGLREPQAPRIHYLWGVSVVLVADSWDGKAYLKASGERFVHEGAVTRALAARNPGRLPDVLAIDDDRGWMLMRDFGGSDLGELPPTRWYEGLDALADLQQGWLGRDAELLELGAEDRSLDALASWVAATEDDHDLLGGLSEAERREWRATVGSYVNACADLAGLGVAPTLVHGDFHPWNVAVRDSGAVVFDWTDASVSHPFLDLATYVMRASGRSVRADMVGRYLDRWRPTMTEREGVVDLCLVVGALYQAQTYAQLLPTVMPEDLSNLRGGDAQWIGRAMRFRRDGLAAAY